MNLRGAGLDGAAFIVGELRPDAPAYVAEGIGQAWSIHHATGHAAAVAFGAGNLERVAASIKGRAARVVLVADRGKEGTTEAAARRLGCAWVAPPPDLENGADVNDLHARDGLEAVRECLAKAQSPAANDNAKPPLFDLAAASIADMLTDPPPRREYLVDDFLPRGITGAVVAPGGTGKSFLLMQLAVAVAAADGFLGYRTPEPAGVLMLAAEDDRDEIHRRLSAVLDLPNLNRSSAFEMGRLDLIARNLHILPRVGDENRLTLRGPDGTISASPLVDQVIAAARQVPDLRLIILDPVPVSGWRREREQRRDAVC